MNNDTKDFFNRKARIWDARRLPDAGKIRTMLALSDIRPGSLILDVGCGTGILEPYLLKYKPRKIVAVDFAENMVNEAKRKFKDPRLEFVCADIFDISPEIFRCDYCFFFNVFPHFGEQKRLSAHIRSLMSPGGRITISHTQGIKNPEKDFVSPGLPARAVVDVISGCFRPDVIVDNNVLLMVSAVALSNPTEDQSC